MAIPLETPVAAAGWNENGSPPSLMPHHAPQGRVIENLKQWMKEGVLSDGSTLPSERVLSEQFQVNRGTVRRALQILQEEGLLRTQNGRTRIVTQQPRQRAGALRNTVALITPLFSDRYADDRHRGRREYIGRGTLEGIRQIGKHAMSLNPDFLTKSEVDELVCELPYGVVITESSAQSSREVELATWFKESGIPVCVYGDNPATATFDRVTSDQADGSYQLTKYLIEQGARRILNFWSAPGNLYWHAQRQEGYERALIEAGLMPLALAIMPPFPETNGDRAIFDSGVRSTVGYLVEHLVGPQPIDALLLSTDNDYFGVAAACRLCGKEPQRDVLLVGYDNYWHEEDKRSFEPTVPLATVDKCNQLMGQELVNLLVERVEGRLPDGPQKRIVKPQMIVSSDR